MSDSERRRTGFLTEAELAEVFEDFIKPDLFADASPNPVDQVVLIGGQPGAGKTRASSEIVATYEGPIVQIVGDDLRVYHPLYASILEEDPSFMPDYTAEASGAWVRMAINHALDRQISVMIEGTFRRPELTIETIARFSDRNFQTHLAALAVPEMVSLKSTLDRYVEGIKLSGTGRWTSLDAHDAGFLGTYETVRIAYRELSVDRISVHTRGGEVIYDELLFNEDPWRRGPGNRFEPRNADAGSPNIHMSKARSRRPTYSEATDWVKEFFEDVEFLHEQRALGRTMRLVLTSLMNTSLQFIQSKNLPEALRNEVDRIEWMIAQGTI